jgi:very-short-patch-repair endonuclease
MFEEMERLRQVAAGQHRVVLSSALPGLGIATGVERRLRAEGWLTVVQPGAVLVGGGTASEWQRVVAAWLLAGPGAIVSHSTAARIHRFDWVPPPQPGEPIELSVVRPSHRRPAGCVVHRYRDIPPEWITGYRGVRVTTAVRTLVDLLPRWPPVIVEKAVDEGSLRRLWTMAELDSAAAVSGRRAGIDYLRRLLAARSGRSTARSDSHLEVRVQRALASFRPFETLYQVTLDGQVFVLDIAWPQFRVAVECEGWEVRSRSRRKFDHERRRDNLLVAHGWTVVRLTSAMTADEMRAAVHTVLLRAAAAGH